MTDDKLPPHKYPATIKAEGAIKDVAHSYLTPLEKLDALEHLERFAAKQGQLIRARIRKAAK
jgi:hypothetical protein